MNGMAAFQGPASGRIRDPLITMIKKCGLLGSLQLCLDAGDYASYSSGQVWNDVSGNGNHFNLGAGSGSDGADPTFNGTAGSNTKDEYWIFDGGDYFTLAGAVPSWAHAFFKDNGVGTLCTMAYINTSVGNQAFADLYGVTGGYWIFGINPDSTFYFATYNDAAALQIAATSTATMSEDAWHFVGASFDEGANAHNLKIDDTNNTSADTAPTPGTTNSNGTMHIGTTTAYAAPLESGARMAFMLIWSRKLSSTELDNFQRYIRHKYGV